MQSDSHPKGRKLPLSQALCLVVILALAIGTSAPADTVKLKDGSVLEGKIVAEDDAQITIEMQYAGGTITKRETINKNDVAEIHRLTDEEKAYLEVQKRELNPTASFPLERYDQVINEVFRTFLARFPDSTHREEVMNQIILWEGERAKVAAGMAKYRGQWMAASEAARLVEKERVQQLLQQGRALLEQKHYDQAIQQFTAAAATVKRPDVLLEIRHLQADTYKQWLESLDHQRRKLAQDIEVYVQEAHRARQARVQTEVSRWESQLTVKRDQLAKLDREISAVQARASKVGVSVEVAQASDTTAPSRDSQFVPSGPAYAPPLWDNILAWMKQRWVLVAVCFLILIAGFLRLLIGR